MASLHSKDGPPTATTATEEEIFDGFGDAEEDEEEGARGRANTGTNYGFDHLDKSHDMGRSSILKVGVCVGWGLYRREVVGPCFVKMW